MFKRNDIANLKNIIWAIEKIENSLKEVKNMEVLSTNEEKLDSIIVKLLNIGESANNLSEEIKNKYNQVDWNSMYKMRNIIAHSYHKISTKIIWDIVKIVKNELPIDKKQVQNILRDLQSIH